MQVLKSPCCISFPFPAVVYSVHTSFHIHCCASILKNPLFYHKSCYIAHLLQKKSWSFKDLKSHMYNISMKGTITRLLVWINGKAMFPVLPITRLFVWINGKAMFLVLPTCHALCLPLQPWSKAHTVLVSSGGPKGIRWVLLNPNQLTS